MPRASACGAGVRSRGIPPHPRRVRGWGHDRRAGSPYARALGDRIAQLPPALQRYFGTIPDGFVGRGEGVFDRVGSRRRVLAPLLRWFADRGVVPAGSHGRCVRIENRTLDGVAVAVRRFDLPTGAFTMHDAVRATPLGTVVDRVGRPPRVAVEFTVHVAGGALELHSVAVGIRLGRSEPRLPAWAAPRIRLRERSAGDRQRVEFTMDLPLIGRVYEYAGTFDYRIEEDR